MHEFTNINSSLDQFVISDALSLNMDEFININSPLDQFEIRDLLSINAPVLGNLSLSLTNIGLYLTIAGYLILTLSVLSDNNKKIIPNS